MSERDLLYCAICGNITPHERRPESNRWICMQHDEPEITRHIESREEMEELEIQRNQNEESE